MSGTYLFHSFEVCKVQLSAKEAPTERTTTYDENILALDAQLLDCPPDTLPNLTLVLIAGTLSAT